MTCCADEDDDGNRITCKLRAGGNRCLFAARGACGLTESIPTDMATTVTSVGETVNYIVRCHPDGPTRGFLGGHSQFELGSKDTSAARHRSNGPVVGQHGGGPDTGDDPG